MWGRAVLALRLIRVSKFFVVAKKYFLLSRTREDRNLVESVETGKIPKPAAFLGVAHTSIV